MFHVTSDIVEVHYKSKSKRILKLANIYILFSMRLTFTPSGLKYLTGRDEMHNLTLGFWAIFFAPIHLKLSIFPVSSLNGKTARL